VLDLTILSGYQIVYLVGGNDGIACGEQCNAANQSQEDLERTAQEAFDNGSGSFSGLRFRKCYANNYFCEQQLYYSVNLPVLAPV
jgi:hypothetical protein